MKVFTLDLLENKTEFGFMPTLTAMLLDGNPQEKAERPAVLVVPGGGYGHVSYREGERIALSYNAAGYHAFILNYCVAPHVHPLPILNVSKSLELIRENAQEWGVAADKVAVCGFSAGGHLAASISTLWNDEKIFGNDATKNKLHRPNASILCYPVITSGEYAHRGSFLNLSGSEEETELWNEMSLETRVDTHTPPAFLWHTYSDSCVPVENSLLYASALRKNAIPFELHIYPEGEHGMSLVSDETYWSVTKFTRAYPWMKQSIEWLNIQFGIENLKKD